MLIPVSGHTIRTVRDITEASYAAGVVVVQLPDRTFVTHVGRQMAASGTAMVEFAAEANEIGPIPAGMPIISAVGPNDTRLQINIVTLGQNGAAEYANVVKSYHAIFQAAGEHKLDSLVMPPLGTKEYGNLTPEESARALKFSLKRYTAERGAGLDIFIACADPKVLSAFEEALQPNPKVQQSLATIAAIKGGFMAVAAGGAAAIGVGAGYYLNSHVTSSAGNLAAYFGVAVTIPAALFALNTENRSAIKPWISGGVMGAVIGVAALMPGIQVLDLLEESQTTANAELLRQERIALGKENGQRLKQLRKEIVQENNETLKPCEKGLCQLERDADGKPRIVMLQDKYSGKVLTFDFTGTKPVTTIGQPVDLSEPMAAAPEKVAPVQP